MIAAITGPIGVGWLLLDALGTEWDYCPGTGGHCIAGWKVGLGFIAVAVSAGVVGLKLFRRPRDDSRSGESLA